MDCVVQIHLFKKINQNVWIHPHKSRIDHKEISGDEKQTRRILSSRATRIEETGNWTISQMARMKAGKWHRDERVKKRQSPWTLSLSLSLFL